MSFRTQSVWIGEMRPCVPELAFCAPCFHFCSVSTHEVFRKCIKNSLVLSLPCILPQDKLAKCTACYRFLTATDSSLPRQQMALKMPCQSSSCSSCWGWNWYRRFGLWVKKVDKQTKLTVGSGIREKCSHDKSIVRRMDKDGRQQREIKPTTRRNTHTHTNTGRIWSTLPAREEFDSAEKEWFFSPVQYLFSCIPLLNGCINFVYRAGFNQQLSLST